ncbi:hypothetical protein ACIS_00285 [Anaplasma centrale str. Israel]|uniref:Uncharacterized protein n=1 Tax=Anaplasma centrale (strain Israel) TaxID=574556 RepID=D1ATS5_ANACI|nr:hypothetical protein [Anaplasma centrale]ACZ48953.1 hypothetical protein ACIS_00285 [Anaplasma centrale str. Israel]
MKRELDDDIGGGVRSLILRKPISNVYFRLGAFCAAVFAAVAAFAFAYAISAGVAFSWYAPVFIVAVVSTVTLLLSLAFMSIMSALQSRSGRVQYASGTIQAPFGCSSKRLDISVRRHGVQGGYGVFQSVLACTIVCSLIAAALAGGVVVGRSQALPSIASLAARMQSIESIAFVAAVAVLLISCLLLFCVRVFTDGATPRVNMFVVMASNPDSSRTTDSEESSPSSVTRGARGAADGPATRNARTADAEAEQGPAHNALRSTSWISALMGLEREASGVCIKCIIDARSLQ